MSFFKKKHVRLARAGKKAYNGTVKNGRSPVLGQLWPGKGAA